jgi:hypothetical protein
MKNTIKKRLNLLMKAQAYAKKMRKGPVFVTDFKVVFLLDEMIREMQEMLGENLKLKEELKSEILFKKSKGRQDK